MSPIQRQTMRARRARARMKVIVNIMMAYGYAMLGASLWEPLSSGGPLQGVNLVVAGVGLVMHAAAVYITPEEGPE